MRIPTRTLLGVVAVVVTLACQPRLDTAIDAGSAEAALRARSRALVTAEARKDVDAAMAFYEQDAVIHIEGASALRGHAAIRQLYQQFFQMPMVSFEATITDVQIARSGELAYESGINHFTFERGGQRVAEQGKYLAVWRRRAGGPWNLGAVAVTNDVRPQ